MTTERAGREQSRHQGAYGTGRDALLTAAVRVVADRGLRNLTYRSVAQEAGVTHGLVTHYFGTREELLIQALQYTLDKSVPGITAAPGTGRIDMLFAGLTEIVAAEPETQAFQYELTLESRRTAGLRPHVIELYDSYRKALSAELARAGIGGDALVNLIFAAVDGLVFQQLCDVNNTATEAALDELRGIMTLLQSRAQGSASD